MIGVYYKSHHSVNVRADQILDTWGFADVKAGVAAIGDWIQTVEWEGALVNLNRWLVSGHSNGGQCPGPIPLLGYLQITGQGTWYALTHYPDNIIGGAPISSYPSIQGKYIEPLILQISIDQIVRGVGRLVLFIFTEY